MRDFKIYFEPQKLDDLRARLKQTRLPRPWEGVQWEHGTSTDALGEVLEYWQSAYDWESRERELNQIPQYLCEIDQVTLHFLYVKGARPQAQPLLLTHGWPDSFLRYVKIIPYLRDFTLVIPSLPGFAFSGLPPQGYCSNAQTAGLWHKLMTQVLGYKHYLASGGDMGRGVSCYLAALYPEEVSALHLTDGGLASELLQADPATLSEAERTYRQRAQLWLKEEGAYISVHSTKPQSLSYALSDSPAGLAAWLLEKYHAWSEAGLLSPDDLCDCLTLYWLCNCAGTSLRAYYANAYTLPPLGRITAPTAFALFPYDVLPVPEEWLRRHYEVVRLTKMEHGGHFTALEQPEAFTRDLAQFALEIS